MTFYSPDGVCGKVGDSYSLNYIEPLMREIDHFESLRAKAEYTRTKKNIKRRLYKLRDKAKHRIDDLHWKTCKYLCSAFDTIFLPEFRVSEMVEKVPDRVISKKTVRSMLNLKHCEFRARLMYYAKTKHRRVVFIDESYTTKTCGQCGMEQNVGGSKIFSCECGYTLDRDYHGARNMVIKLLS
jgi:putative transposase